MTISDQFATRGERSSSAPLQAQLPDREAPSGPALADSMPAWDLLPPHSVIVRRTRDA